MAALVFRAIDQETANASGAHFSKGDLLVGEGGHVPIMAGSEMRSNGGRHSHSGSPSGNNHMGAR